MVSPDTIVPDPTNPQSFNRYSYVYNNPVKFTDSTGHCAEFGDDECWGYYDQIINQCPGCADLRLEWFGSPFLKEYNESLQYGWRPYSVMEGIWLGMLEESGALGQELAEYFRTEGIKINFVNKDFAMRLELNGSISVGRGYIDRMVAQEGYDAHKLFFTQFGHEIQHHQQGYINAVSIQGEYLAYETQMELAKNWDNAHGTNTSRTLNAEVLPTLGDWDTLATNLDATSYADMTQFYNHFLAPHYKWTPIFPWPSEIRRMLE